MPLGVTETTTTIRLVVIGCDYITSLGLKQVLAEAPYIEVAGVAPALHGRSPANDHADLVILDASLPREQLLKACMAYSNHTLPPKVVILGEVPLDLAELLFYAGAAAMLHKGSIGADLPAALRMIHRDSILAFNAAARTVMKHRQRPETIFAERLDSLTARERVVADGIAGGLTNSQLAARLHVSEATVKVLVANIMAKMGVNNRVQIAVSVTKAKAT